VDELQALRQDTYVVLVARNLWENLPGVLWGGLLFSLCCLPAFMAFAVGWLAPTLLIGSVTIAPAWTALLAYERTLLIDESIKTAHFFHTVRYSWRRSAFLGGMGAFPVLATITTLPLLRQNDVPLLVWLGLGADFLGMALMAALLLYAFPLLVHTDQGVRILLRDALILSSRRPFHTLGLLGMGILFGFAVAYISLGLLFLLPAIYGMFVVANCLLVMQPVELPKSSAKKP
jgi:uncharacterized membrane protein YesL